MKIYSVTERQKKNSIITEEDFETDYLESIVPVFYFGHS